MTTVLDNFITGSVSYGSLCWCEIILITANDNRQSSRAQNLSNTASSRPNSVTDDTEHFFGQGTWRRFNKPQIVKYNIVVTL